MMIRVRVGSGRRSATFRWRTPTPATYRICGRSSPRHHQGPGSDGDRSGCPGLSALGRQAGWECDEDL